MSGNNFLQQNWPCLVKNLRSPLIHGILDKMFSDLHLSQDEYDHVYSCKETDCDKARRLLQLVTSRGEPALRFFKETLKEHNPELYESFGETDGDSSSPVTLEKALFSSGHDSDDSGSSGVESASPASLGTPSDEEEDGRSAEPLKVTVGAVNEMMEELEKKGTELRLKSCMREAKQTFNDLAQLADLCAKQEEGEVGFQIKHLKRKSVLEAFQSSYDEGTLGEEVQEQFAKLVEENSDILKVETDVKVVWKEEQDKNRDKEQAKGYDGIIKVSAKELKLADDYVLEAGSQGAFESLCDYLVENPDELDEIITYLNKIKVQVYDITRGCIELQFGCLTGESAVCLQEEDSSGRLSTQFQELMSPFLKQFGLKYLVLDVRCTFSQDTTAETSPKKIAASQPAVYPLTVAQTTSYTATYKSPATDSLQTDTASPGISEDSMMQEECFASDTTSSKVSNTKGLVHSTSVDNLMALPPPIRKVDHSSLRGLDLAIVGGKDLSCTDAAYDASILNFTVRQVQTGLRLRSKKAQLQQKDVLKTAREDTEALVHSLSMEIKMLTQKEEEAQKILLELKQELQQVKDTNKSYETNIEKLTAQIVNLSNRIPSLQDEVKTLSEKGKTLQNLLSERNLEIQQLQETSKIKEAKLEQLTAENKKLSSQIPNVQNVVKRLSEKEEKSQTVLLETLATQQFTIQELHQRAPSRKERSCSRTKTPSGSEKSQYRPEESHPRPAEKTHPVIERTQSGLERTQSRPERSQSAPVKRQPGLERTQPRSEKSQYGLMIRQSGPEKRLYGLEKRHSVAERMQVTAVKATHRASMDRGLNIANFIHQTKGFLSENKRSADIISEVWEKVSADQRKISEFESKNRNSTEWAGLSTLKSVNQGLRDECQSCAEKIRRNAEKLKEEYRYIWETIIATKRGVPVFLLQHGLGQYISSLAEIGYEEVEDLLDAEIKTDGDLADDHFWVLFDGDRLQMARRHLRTLRQEINNLCERITNIPNRMQSIIRSADEAARISNQFLDACRDSVKRARTVENETRRAAQETRQHRTHSGYTAAATTAVAGFGAVLFRAAVAATGGLALLAGGAVATAGVGAVGLGMLTGLMTAATDLVSSSEISSATFEDKVICSLDDHQRKMGEKAQELKRQWLNDIHACVKEMESSKAAVKHNLVIIPSSVSSIKSDFDTIFKNIDALQSNAKKFALDIASWSGHGSSTYCSACGTSPCCLKSPNANQRDQRDAKNKLVVRLHSSHVGCKHKHTDGHRNGPRKSDYV